MNLEEKQSNALLPPEQLTRPPYSPGSLPPLTKSKFAGKSTLYERDTDFALERFKGSA